MHGSLGRYKVRLVAKGFFQLEGVEFSETFSPVVKSTIVTLVLALATASQWNLHQLGVNNAFLHGDLPEEVYMCVLQGFQTTHKNQVRKLKNSLYGLKHTSRQWNCKLVSFLTSFGFVQSKLDYSLLFKQNGATFTILARYLRR